MAIDGNSQYFGITLLEFFHLGTESDDLGRADKREVQRIEKQNDILSLKVGKFDFFKTAIRHHGLGAEIWGRFSN